MQTGLFDFSCSDAVLTQEWEARVSIRERETLSDRILKRLDTASTGNTSEPDIEPIVSPLQTILGISAEEPGFDCVRVAPRPADLDWAKGRLTLPEGSVSVSWARRNGRFILDVSIPVGIHLKAVLPAHPEDTLFVNGEPVDPDSQTIRTARHVELAVLPGSDYKFEVLSTPSV